VEPPVCGRFAFVADRRRLSRRRQLLSLDRQEHAALVQLSDLIDARKQVSPGQRLRVDDQTVEDVERGVGRNPLTPPTRLPPGSQTGVPSLGVR
jgi:hypothetical protein